MEFLNFQPLHWYIAGPLIGLTIPLLLYFINKPLGISFTLNQLCAFCIPKKYNAFKIDKEKDGWRLYFLLGIILAGAIYFGLSQPYKIDINAATQAKLTEIGLSQQEGFLPSQIFNTNLSSPFQWLLLIGGGFLIGFGTRYAGGCTSGHTIMGLSQLNLGSLLATIGFFIGGLIGSWFLIPYISQLL
jgi:uncharacterized membrane protein YedE/YeeE